MTLLTTPKILQLFNLATDLKQRPRKNQWYDERTITMLDLQTWFSYRKRKARKTQVHFSPTNYGTPNVYGTLSAC